MTYATTETDRINRIGWAFGAFAAFAGAGALISSPWLMPALWPGVGKAFAFDPDFLPIGGPLVVGMWMLNAMLSAVVFSDGRWRPVTRHLDIALTALWVVVMAWLVVGPRIFLNAPSDEAAKFWIAVVLVIVVLSTIPKIRRASRG
ncbi:MAG: hypothetical protein ABL973_15295 [Micropepsaceae bacterium]